MALAMDARKKIAWVGWVVVGETSSKEFASDRGGYTNPKKGKSGSGLNLKVFS